ncbi:DUF402 domain-containing protein [Gordonia sp. (in: high G+C Gram-positive bacteria)]|uniref:DUF402 domain-containing protein n=1 Tax=Gordonia sp. (in: high G+C Gram-positive bacteria) TaxID=84139 RepID=UPI0035AFE9BB
MTSDGGRTADPGSAPHPLHPPKREVFDVPAMTNTDNKGFVREVEEYRVTDFGLYMSRHAPGHPRFDHLESWLLPALGLRANIFHYQGGYREGQRLYLDVGRFAGPDDDGRWHAEDWYLDLVDVPGTPPLLLDTDELLEAHREGLLDTAQCVEAVGIATRALVGAAEHGNDIQAWLDAAAGGAVAFRDHDHRRHGQAGRSVRR